MKVVILGPPGSGKGTEAKLVSKILKLKYISSSGALREEIKKGTNVGKNIKVLMDRGELVDSEVIDKIIKNFIPKNNYIIDGYPRKISEAVYLDNFNKPNIILFLDVPFSVLKKRILNRAKIENRSDDTLEVIKHRYSVYKKETEPLLKYYKDRIIKIDGNRSIEVIKKDIIKRLKK